MRANRDRAFHGVHSDATVAGSDGAAPRRRDERELTELDVFGTLKEKHHKNTVKTMRAMYADVRERRRRAMEDLTPLQRRARASGGVNPFDWSDGHVGHFYEFMVAENAASERGAKSRAMVFERQDESGQNVVEELFDSFRADYADRWRAEVVCGIDASAGACERYRDAAAEACEALLGDDDAREMGACETYLHTYGIVHEHWHVEDYVQARNTLGYSKPKMEAPKRYPANLWGDSVLARSRNGECSACSTQVITLQGYVDVDVGTTYSLGAEREDKWVFDAERWAHDVPMTKFKIAKTCCTNAQFACFVETGGYADRSLWSHEGWRWVEKRRAAGELLAPLGWKVSPCVKFLSNGEEAPACESWRCAYFDEAPRALHPQHPVCHVSWYEAEAYCNWIGARLPTEAEWEAAARTTTSWSTDKQTTKRRTYPWGEESPSEDKANLGGHFGGTIDVSALGAGDSAHGCRQMLGNVWEWTASAFLPFPGFQMDFPYRENSCPWFGYRKVVKGGCWATSAPIARAAYRHSFWPHMHNTFSGFRAAIGGSQKRALCILPQKIQSGAKCGNVVTMERISSHLEKNHIMSITRSIFDLPQSKEDLANIIHAMNVDLIIVLHAFKCGAVIDTVQAYKDMLPPIILVLGGTDVNVDSRKSALAEEQFRRRVDVATKVVSFSLSMIEAAPKGALKFIESDSTSKTKLIPQGVMLPSTLKASKRKRLADETVETPGELQGTSRPADLSIPIMFLPAGLRPVKDVCFINDALTAYNSNGIKAHLTVCGPFLDSAYAKRVRCQFDGRSDCTLLAGVDRATLVRFIGEAKVLLNTSVSEGQSGTIAEAMMVGTLVFARDIPGNRQLFELCEARALAALGPATIKEMKGDGWEVHPVGVLFSTPEGCMRAFEALGLERESTEDVDVSLIRLRAREGVAELSLNEAKRWTEILDEITAHGS